MSRIKLLEMKCLYGMLHKINLKRDFMQKYIHHNTSEPIRPDVHQMTMDTHIHTVTIQISPAISELHNTKESKACSNNSHSVVGFTQHERKQGQL